MKTKFFLTVAIILATLFTSCKKTEIITNELTSIEKSIGGVIENTHWEVVSVVSIPKSVYLRWTNKNPKLSFFSDFIQLRFGRDICDKHYMIAGDDVIVNYSNCVIGNQNNQDLTDLLEGRFKYTISDDGESMTIKNDLETEIVLRRIVQIQTTTTPVNLTIQ